MMRDSTLNLHRLRLLRELSLRGTVGEVARTLGYSPSTVSQQLARLEAEAGVILLESVGRRVRLTREGEVLVQHADGIFDAVLEAQSSLRATSEGNAGTIRVACFQTAMLAVLPQVIERLRSRRPQLQVKVSEFAPDRMIDALLAHDFDLVLGEEYPGLSVQRHPSIEVDTVAVDRLCVVSRQVSLREVRSLSDLAGVDWVMEPPGNAAREWALEQCRRAGFEPRLTVESADLLVHARMVEAGLVTAFLPDLIWAGGMQPVAPRMAQGSMCRIIFTANRVAAANDPALTQLRREFSSSLRRMLTQVMPPQGVFA